MEGGRGRKEEGREGGKEREGWKEGEGGRREGREGEGGEEGEGRREGKGNFITRLVHTGNKLSHTHTTCSGIYYMYVPEQLVLPYRLRR